MKLTELQKYIGSMGVFWNTDNPAERSLMVGRLKEIVIYPDAGEYTKTHFVTDTYFDEEYSHFCPISNLESLI